MYLPLSNITIEEIKADFLEEKNINLSMLRLDKLHETVSGNKLFKLHYYIEKCLQTNHKTLLTFGGAFSNHLVATSFLCQQMGIKCIGIIRGNEASELSHSLITCINNGMILEFVNPATYKNPTENKFVQWLKDKFGECTIVPEGGFGKDGARGAGLIMDLFKKNNFTHVCTCVGTATTLAGLLINCEKTHKIIAIPAIKNMTDIEQRLTEMEITYNKGTLDIFLDYHFGGYAKYDTNLINFMNTFYTEYKIPLDFVYTAKMMYGAIDKIKTGYFPTGSKIICLHTGGLQGNLSFPTGTLIF